MLSPRNNLAESNQFHGLSITEDITPIFSFPLLPIFPACLLCQWPCSAGPDWPGVGTRTHLFHPGALKEMPSSLVPSLSLSLFHAFSSCCPHTSFSLPPEVFSHTFYESAIFILRSLMPVCSCQQSSGDIPVWTAHRLFSLLNL